MSDLVLGSTVAIAYSVLVSACVLAAIYVLFGGGDKP